MCRKTLCLAAVAVLTTATACNDRPIMTAPPPDRQGAAPLGAPPSGAKPERLARLVAKALGHPVFRAYVQAQLAASPFREHKVHFQRFLGANGGRARRDIARENGAAEADVQREADAALELEMYLPVPAHRAAWSGGENVLVATAIADHEAPVAFDVQGGRRLLSPEEPPATPVLALVPVESDFSIGPQFMEECLDCGEGGGGGGGGGYTPLPPPPPAPGLYMTKSHFVDDFEGWLKGSPEFEVHILGQKGATDSLKDYQCAGEHAGGPYVFDQNGKDWSGSVLLFSKTQIDSYNAAHPNQNFRVFYVEDDDTACEIKADKALINDLFKAVDGAYRNLTAGNDSSTTAGKYFKRANALQKLWAAIASLIRTNDELIGDAVEDDVVGQFYSGFNWIVKGRSNVTNGWVNLVIK